jgi:hypothetical protein
MRNLDKHGLPTIECENKMDEFDLTDEMRMGGRHGHDNNLQIGSPLVGLEFF